MSNKTRQLQDLLTKLRADELALLICTDQREAEQNARALVQDFACKSLDDSTSITPNGGIVLCVTGEKNVRGLHPRLYGFDDDFRFRTNKQLYATLEMREYLESIGVERL